MHEVAVGEHAALGLTGRAGGVDDRGQGRGGEAGPAVASSRLVADAGARGRELRDGAVVEAPHVPQRAAGRGDPAAWSVVSTTATAAPESAQHPVQLVRGGRLVDRHGHRAGEPDGVVQQRPLVAGPRQQGDPVARRPTPDAIRPLATATTSPWNSAAVRCDQVRSVPEREDRLVGVLARVGDHVVGERAGRAGGAARGVAYSRMHRLRVLDWAIEWVDRSGTPYRPRARLWWLTGGAGRLVSLATQDPRTSEATWLSRPPRAS